jgi:hypothetical protein
LQLAVATARLFSHTQPPPPPPLPPGSLLERGNLVMRDLEPWESDFIQLKMEREAAFAKPYPKELLDMWTAGDRVMEDGEGGKGGGAAVAKEGVGEGGASSGKGEGGKGGAKKGGAGGGGAGAAAAGAPAPAPPPPSAAPGVTLGDFYERSDAVGGGSASTGTVALAPRFSAADKIGDTRSLDRAYSSRLLLLVRAAGSGKWGLPSAEAHEGEPLVQAAERGLRAAFGAGAHLDVWYVGRAPVGHWLRAFSPEEASARGCYGERGFVYRAELLEGRFRMPALREGGAGGCAYDDFHWLTRDETEAFLERPAYKYLHQVMGGGAGEEHARNAKWLRDLGGRSVGGATRNRALRVKAAAPLRLPAVATAEQARVAALPWGPEKTAALAEESKRRAARVAEQRLRTQANREMLALRPRVEAVRAALAAARAAAAGHG